MKILTRLYSIYIVAVFISLFIVFMIPFLFIAQKEKWHQLALKINHIWAILFFKLSFLPYEIIYKTKLEKDQQYIICANHFSFLDIPAMGLLPVLFKFFGKSSLSSIPIFGYMYRKIHITVDRSSLQSKRQSFEQAKEALDSGFNLAIFPEGGIFSKEPPKMVPFKEGAFSLAIQKRVPILPVTFITNHRILPDDSRLLVQRMCCKIVVNPPISSDKMSNQSIDLLKQQVFETIQDELEPTIMKKS